MERTAFEQLTLSSAADRKRRAGFLPLSIAVHACAVGAVLVVPVLTSTDMPNPALASEILAAPATLVPPPPPPRGIPPRSPGRRPQPAPSPIGGSALTVPTSWSDTLLPEGSLGNSMDIPECEGCVPWGVEGGVPTRSPVPPDPAPSPPVVRPGGKIALPVKLRDVAPAYPELAREAHVEGLVIIECHIDTEGGVAGARVLRGHPLLDAAALDAVRQWRYRPTLLNGEPVSVLMTVTVRFSLRR